MASSPLLPLLLVGLLASGLAGCMDDAPQEWAALVQGSECSGAAAGKCRVVDGVLVVEGVQVEAATFVGLRIQDPTGPVLVRGLRASGVEIAIDVGPTCSACTVTVTDAELHPRAVGVRLGEQGRVEGAVALDRSRIVTGEQPGTYIFGNATLGIYARNMTGSLSLQDTALEAAYARPGSRAVWNRGASIPLTLSNVEMTRYGRGITGDLTTLTLRNVGIKECGYDAIYSTTLPDVDADGLRVDGCAKGIPECTGDECGAAILLYGPLGQTGNRAAFRNAFFTNNTFALHVQNYWELRMDRFSITDGDAGAGMAMTEATITNGTVARQAGYGMRLGVDRLTMRGVAFLDNGHGPAVVNGQNVVRVGLDILSGAPSRGATYGPRIIQGCTFSGNLPFGLKYQDPPPLDARTAETLLDARYNWWGSPAGPSPWVMGDEGDERPLPGFGDAVALMGFVMTEPHLTSPP